VSGDLETIATVIGLLGVALALLRWLYRAARRLDELFRLLSGTEERPGLAEWMGAVDDRLAVIEAEFRPNGGTSQRDQITEIKAMLWQLLGQQPPEQQVSLRNPKRH
jgi:hypothetical protein